MLWLSLGQDSQGHLLHGQEVIALFPDKVSVGKPSLGCKCDMAGGADQKTFYVSVGIKLCNTDPFPHLLSSFNGADPAFGRGRVLAGSSLKGHHETGTTNSGLDILPLWMLLFKRKKQTNKKIFAIWRESHGVAAVAEILFRNYAPQEILGNFPSPDREWPCRCHFMTLLDSSSSGLASL